MLNSITIQRMTIDNSEKENGIVKYSYGNSFIKISEKPQGFLAEDFAASYPGIKYIEIYDLYVDKKYRHQGIATKLVKEVITRYEGYVILAAAGASMLEYTEEPSDEEKIKITESLRPFWESMGFKDINHIFAGYEFKNAYIYTGNAMGLVVYLIEQRLYQNKNKE